MKKIQELAACIHQDATTCNFSAIEDPQNEAIRTQCICSIGNEAVLKMLLEENDGTLTFTKAIELACEMEDEAQVAKETIYGSNHQTLKSVHAVKRKHNKATALHSLEREPTQNFSGICMRCDNANHKPSESRY